MQTTTETTEQIEPWSSIERRALELIAKQLFKCDVHEQHNDYREHCGACVLRGYLSESAIADGQSDADGPNYAGWARCYVQAQKQVPLRWMRAFLGQLESDNDSYSACLKRDVATWRVIFMQ